MNTFGDTWRYLTDGGNWIGEGGLLDLMLEQLLLSFSALALAVVVGLPIALWLGHIGRGGFLAIVFDVLIVLAQRVLTPWTRGARS